MLNNPIILGTKLPTLADPAVPGEVLAGKQLIDANGNILTGTMPAVAAATPGISVSSSGLITATAQQTAGYVAAGTKTATQQLPTQGAASITPGTTSKIAVSSGVYTTGVVTVAGDSNLVAGNIKENVSIFGVVGTLKASQGELTRTVASVTSVSTTTLKFTVPSSVDPETVQMVMGWANVTNIAGYSPTAFPVKGMRYVLTITFIRNSNVYSRGWEMIYSDADITSDEEISALNPSISMSSTNAQWSISGRAFTLVLPTNIGHTLNFAYPETQGWSIAVYSG